MKGIAVQFVSTITLTIPNFLMGFSTAWTSYASDILINHDSPLKEAVTTRQVNFLSALPMLGCVLSTITTGLLSESVGRKKIAILSGMCFTVSWSIITLSTGITQLLIGRFVCGISTGMHLVIIYVYIGEYSQVSLRGTLSSMTVLAYSFGTLSSYVAGWQCSYNTVNYFMLIMGVTFVGLMSFLWESPAYLLSKGRDAEALDSLKFYRGAPKITREVLEEMARLWSQRLPNGSFDVNDIEKEAEITKAFVDKLKLGKEDSLKKPILTVKRSAWGILYTSKPTQRALFTVTLLIMLTVFMGMVNLQAYAGTLFQKATPSSSSHFCSVILAVTLVVASGVSSIISDLVGRRVLMITSCASNSFAMALLASILHWSWAPEWITSTVILLMTFSFQLGACVVPYIQLAESFMPEVKSLASLISMTAMWAASFIVLALFGPAVEKLGWSGTFMMFSIVGTATTVVAYYMMKETKGVPVEAIQDLYDEDCVSCSVK